jgi:hypothetical protein
MAKLYTLLEAADRLGLTPEVFRRKLKTEWVKDLQMIPGNPPHFRAADVDEFARVLGAASDPGLTPGNDPGEFNFAVASEAAPLPPRPPAAAADEPLLIDADDDILSLPASGKLASGKTGSDSDVRLDPAPARRPAASDDQSGPTEEISIDLAGPSSAVIKSSSGSAGRAEVGVEARRPRVGQDAPRHQGLSPAAGRRQFQRVRAEPRPEQRLART